MARKSLERRTGRQNLQSRLKDGAELIEDGETESYQTRRNPCCIRNIQLCSQLIKSFMHKGIHCRSFHNDSRYWERCYMKSAAGNHSVNLLHQFNKVIRNHQKWWLPRSHIICSLKQCLPSSRSSKYFLKHKTHSPEKLGNKQR